MPFITIGKNDLELYYKDWGSGHPFVFCHGWPLSSDAFEDQMFFVASNGFRAIAHDRRGHGRSSQSWNGNDLDTYADDLHALMEYLDLRDAILVGHSTGGGEVARYIGRHGTKRIAKAVLIGAITPILGKSANNPNGVPKPIFDDIRKNVLADRSQYFKDFSEGFYGANRPNSKVSQGLRDSFWLQAMCGGLKNIHDCIKAFSETDLTDDVKKINVPTLIIHGDDDQIVPLDTTARATAKLVDNARLEIIKDASHGLCSTHKEEINKMLIAFARE